MVVKMLWKRLGSDWRNSARSTTEKRTGRSGPSHDPWSPHSPTITAPQAPAPVPMAQDTEAGKHEDEDGSDGRQGSHQGPGHFLEAGQEAVGRGGEGG